MSNPKTILEINKKLSQYTTEVLAGAVEASDRARDQLKNAKLIEADLFARIKARDVRRALEKEEREAVEAATASPENVSAAGATAAQETTMKEETAEKVPAEPVQKEKPVVMEVQPAAGSAESEKAEERKQKPVISAKETKLSSNEGNTNTIENGRQQESGRKLRSSDGERRPPRRENTSEAPAHGHENKNRKKQDSDRGY